MVVNNGKWMVNDGNWRFIMVDYGFYWWLMTVTNEYLMVNGKYIMVIDGYPAIVIENGNGC